MSFTLRPDQLADVKRYLSEPTHAGLNASDVGSGKTAVAVQAMHEATNGVKLIIAPLNTRDGWEWTIKALTGEQCSVLKSKSPAILDLAEGKAGWYFGGWEYLRQFKLEDLHVDSLILDEVHRLQSRKSLSFATCSRLSKAVRKGGGYVMALSATPYGNKPSGAFGVVNTLWGDDKTKRFHAYWPFVEEYLGKHKNPWSGFFEANDREYHPGDIARSMPLYWRHIQREECCEFHPNGIAADLPERVIHRVACGMTATQRRIYKELQQTSEAWLDEHHLPIEGGYPMVMATRLRQIALAVPTTEAATRLKTDALTGVTTLVDYTKVTYPEKTKGSKLDALSSIVEDLNGERCLVLTHSAGIITPILYRLGKKARAERWDGSVDSKTRQRIKDSFIKGSQLNGGNGEGVQVIVAQIGAIGEGVDGLQRACRNEVWFSKESNALLNTQAAGRLVRTGQRYAVNSWSLEAEDTIEEDQLATLGERGRVMEGALNL